MLDALVVGAGFAGAVIAERLASDGQKVLVIDKRSHIGGNAHDELDSHGVRVHCYGPHIFHTNSDMVVDYLSQFTQWRPYEHRVLAAVDGKLLPIPINRTTINSLYDLDLSETEVKLYLEFVREKRELIKTSEDVVLSTVGRDLCDKFFRGYTKKQWNLDLSELSPGVAGRIPVRTNDDDRYFTDEFQMMPIDGYDAMFQAMLRHKNISVRVGTDFKDVLFHVEARMVFWTGPIDGYFKHCYGKLPYRSLRFEHEHHASLHQYQKVGTVNFPNDHEYTRITEFKHLTGQKCKGTSIVKEYPQAEGEPYYPVLTSDSQIQYQKYKKLAERERDVCFVGRLAEFRYYNMDQTVASALKVAEQFLRPAQRTAETSVII